MKGIMLISQSFEDTEALACRDIIKRAGIELFTISMMASKVVESQYGLNVECDYLLKEVDISQYDFLVIPGGKAVVSVLHRKDETFKIIDHFCENNKLVAAICAAPSLLGAATRLMNKRYTCFPGFEDMCTGGDYVDEGVVEDGNIITAKSMFYSIQFGLEIVKKIKGELVYSELSLSIKGIK